jgi:hypothetical protein
MVPGVSYSIACKDELPYVRLEKDGRECIQRVIISFLNHFGWDKSHLFQVEMPRRGDSDVGNANLMECFILDEVEWLYKESFKRYGTNLDNWPNETSMTRKLPTTNFW